MFSRQRTHVVPVPDRRKHRRFVTLRNFRNVSIVLIVLFAVIEIHSEYHDRIGGFYGRLFNSEVAPVQQKEIEPVREAPPAAVPDQAAADPMLVEPLARAQWLTANPSDPATSTTADAAIVQSNVQGYVQTYATGRVAAAESSAAVVGGPEGVTIVKRDPKRRLAGGFGRP